MFICSLINQACCKFKNVHPKLAIRNIQWSREITSFAVQRYYLWYLPDLPPLQRQDVTRTPFFLITWATYIWAKKKKLSSPCIQCQYLSDFTCQYIEEDEASETHCETFFLNFFFIPGEHFDTNTICLSANGKGAEAELDFPGPDTFSYIKSGENRHYILILERNTKLLCKESYHYSNKN